MGLHQSDTPEYADAYKAFVACTDQKLGLVAYLKGVTTRLRRDVLLDVGAGDGTTTSQLAPSFARTLAIEPSVPMRAQLLSAVPQVEIIDGGIMEAEVDVQADLVVCAHTFYYLPFEEWGTYAQRLVSWRANDGECVIILQNPYGEGMRMLQEFGGPCYSSEPFGKLVVQKQTVQATVKTSDFDTMLAIAYFMLGDGLDTNTLDPDEVERYVREHFAVGGGYVMDVRQDFIHIR